LKYDNFDIWIEKVQDGRYPVLLYPPSLPDSHYLSDEILSPELAERWAEFDKNNCCREDLEKVGRTLFNCLFHGNILNKYQLEFRAIRDDEERGLRIRLFIKDPTMARVPWELLYDPFKKRFLATWIKTPIVRYLQVSDDNRGLTIRPPVKVLVAIPSFSALNVVEEEQIIKSAFADMIKKNLVELDFMTDRVSVTTLNNRLNEKGPFHIFHFVGHGCFKEGEDDSYLLVNSDPTAADSDGTEEMIEVEQLEQLSADDFADLFQNHTSMKLVVLNSCLSARASHTKPLAGVVAKLFAREIPAVVAMQYPIMNTAAIRFAAQFYNSLCKGYQRGLVDVAITGARNLMHIKGRGELGFATPVLFTRSDTGAIFDLRTDDDDDDLEHEIDEPEYGVTLSASPTESSPFPSLRQIGRRLMAPVRLVSEAPRLTALKEIREKNIEAVERKKQEANTSAEYDTLHKELEEERRELAQLEMRLRGVVGASLKLSRTALALALLVFLASTFGLFNLIGIDDYFQQASSNYLRGELLGGRAFADDQVRIILFEEGRPVVEGRPPNAQRSDDRAFHAEMIDALAKAGASVVALDIYPSAETPWDTILANSIKRAEQSGTHVIMGTLGVSESGEPQTIIPEKLREALTNKIGNLETARILAGFRPATRAVVLGDKITRSQPDESGTALFPSLVLQAIRYFNLPANAQPPDLFFDRNNKINLTANNKVVRSITVNDDNLDYYFSPANEEILKGVRQSYQDVYARRNQRDGLNDFRGKIVMIGYDSPEDVHYVNGSRQMPGVEIQACVVSNVLQGISIRRLSWWQNGLIILLLSGIGFALQSKPLRGFSLQLPFESPVLRRLITIPLPLIVVLVTYLTVIYFVYSRSNWEIEMTYHVVALLLSYVLGNSVGELANRVAGAMGKPGKPQSKELIEHA
jgi:CHASE2 domain-containing sensor protein